MRTTLVRRVIDGAERLLYGATAEEAVARRLALIDRRVEQRLDAIFTRALEGGSEEEMEGEVEPRTWWDHRVIAAVDEEPSLGFYHVELGLTPQEQERGVVTLGIAIHATITPRVGDRVSLLIEEGYILRMLVNDEEVTLPWRERERHA